MTHESSESKNEQIGPYQQAIHRFDAENARDPSTELADGATQPRELLYARRLTDWVLRLCPDASEELRLAARSQHLCRWMIPRSSYPMTRAGYLRWRSELKSFHSQKAGQILREVGYPAATITRVQEFILKKTFPDDPESRLLEDALCLVFLQHQFADLAARTAEETMIGILHKTWQKMSPAGRQAALSLPFADREKRLLERALAQEQ